MTTVPGSALPKRSRTSQPVVSPADTGVSPFDAIRRVRPDGSEFWSTRDMQPLMGYSRWENLMPALKRAMTSAANQGLDVEQHFLRSQENPSDKGGRPREDFELSRSAAYLLAMNGDPNKPEVAAAQMYFAAKTREAERGQVAASGDDLDMVQVMLDNLRAQRQRVAAVEQQQAMTAARVEAIEGRHDWFTALGYAKLHDHDTERAYLSRVGRRAAAILREQGQEPHPRQDATFGQVNTYPVAVLAQAFAEVTR